MIVNLHLTDACNFRCAHCFAHFGAKRTLSYGQWKTIVDNILNSMNVERFNLAGGEPLLYGNIAELSEHIKSKGSEVSVITNGYNLSKHKINLLWQSGVSMIGLSIDSDNISTLRNLGRCTASGNVLDPARCIGLCRYIKGKGMTLKINSVISRLNYSEDISSFILSAAPVRWKILKIKEFDNCGFDNKSLLINDKEFNSFIHRHRFIPHIVEKSMNNAYIMVDAFGNLVDTGSNNNFPVANLLNTRFSNAFSKLKFDYGLYMKRYAA